MSKNGDIVTQAVIDAENILNSVKTMTENNAKAILKKTVTEVVKESIETDSNFTEGESIVDNNETASVDEADFTALDSNELEKQFAELGDETELEIVDDTPLELELSSDMSTDVDMGITESNTETIYEIEIEDGQTTNEAIQNLAERNLKVNDTVSTNSEVVYEIELDESVNSIQTVAGKNPYSIKGGKGKSNLAKTYPYSIKDSKGGRKKGRVGNSPFSQKAPNTKNLREGIKAKVKQLVSENTDLRLEVDSLLKERKSQQSKWLQFKQDVSELGLYTTKLSHITKIITENTLTLAEKENIVNVIESGRTIKEVEGLSQKLQKGLVNTNSQIAKTISENISGTKPTLISEDVKSKGSMNPQQNRMKTLMGI